MRGHPGSAAAQCWQAGLGDRVSLYVCCLQGKRTLGKCCILSGLNSSSESFPYWLYEAVQLCLLSVCKCVLCVDKFFSINKKAEWENYIEDYLVTKISLAEDCYSL